MKRVVKVLERARQLLIDKGWCQGKYKNFDGQYCSLGAINAVTKSNKLQEEARKILKGVLPIQISNWNDAPGRTKQQVLGAFKRAITLAKNGSKSYQKNIN